MKILYLTPGCFDKGGISRYNRFQIQALREILGEENVRVYSLRQKRDGDLESPFEVTWSATGSSHLLNKIAFGGKVLECALTWRPDVILVAHVYMSGFVFLVSKASGSKTILNVYGHEVWSGLSAGRRLGMTNCDYVISDCHFTANYLEGVGARRPGTVKVAWDAVDVTRFFPAPPSPTVCEKYGIPDPGKGINLLTLGRLSSGADHKGYRRLLEAFALVARQNDKVSLIYAGSGDLVDILKARANELGVSSRVHFTGSIHDEDLPDVYRAAHIFSLISDRGKGRGEGVPVTPIEAAACGKPILVGNQDGSPEAVMNDENGFVLDSFDINSHVDTILRLAGDPGLRLKMGEAGARIAVTEFSYMSFREKHRKFLSEILSKSGEKK